MSSTFKVCLAIHGHEPAGWAGDASRMLESFAAPAIRVLAAAAVTIPPFTSITPLARRVYDGARTAHLAEETRRLERAVATLGDRLPEGTEVVHVTCDARRLARAITGEAERWGADVLIVGRPAPGFGSWLWPGPVHERVLRLASCAVVVTPPATPSRSPRLVAVPPAVVERRA